jgi:hypothetical protein
MKIVSGLISLSAFLFISSYLLIGCMESSDSSKPSKRIEQAIGSEIYAILKNPDSVSAFRIKPQLKLVLDKEPEAVGPVIDLTSAQKDRLIQILLNDSSYNFDLTKKCIFFAEIVLKFHKDKDVNVFVNSSCSQFKFVINGKAVLLDYDPAKLSVNEFLTELNLIEKD